MHGSDDHNPKEINFNIESDQSLLARTRVRAYNESHLSGKPMETS